MPKTEIIEEEPHMQTWLANDVTGHQYVVLASSAEYALTELSERMSQRGMIFPRDIMLDSFKGLDHAD